MADEPTSRAPVVAEHMSWVRTRIQLDQEMMEWVRHGLSSIGVGFGSFAFLQGVVSGAGEAERVTTPSRGFSLVATALGVALILMATNHNRKMSAWVDHDEFHPDEAPVLPDERRPYVLAAAGVAIGTLSFIGLLLLQ